MYLLLEDMDIDKISDNAFLAVQMICKIVKFLPFITKSDEITKNIYTLENPQFVIYKKRHEKIIADCIYVCRRNCRIFLSFCFFGTLGLAIKPILRTGKPLPLELWLPFDVREQPWMYYFVYVYIVLSVICGGFSNGAIDPLLSGMMYHITAQIKILKNNLQFLGEDVDETLAQHSTTSDFMQAKVLYRKIQSCVQHHMAILEFVDNFERLYSFLVFSQFAASVLVICICCLFLSMVEPLTVVFFAVISFLITILSEIFLFCYYGTTLFEENNSLMRAVYMGNWYDYDNKSKTSLLILMERSKRPLVITAGKLLELSLETFTTILRRAYSLLAVLKNY
ncbi:hypothetical protein Zmor_015687 [Zophobas morio]|uniref:Odorant receptor n=1 Tax=Zophobas morio TaxID=2755281 RepID=A0AA38IH36_9CUCU|nr:hypothetical protein Zmor_015687 [Zophobas morio]